MESEVQEEKWESEKEEAGEKKPRNLLKELLEMVLYVAFVALAAFFSLSLCSAAGGS